MSPDPFVTLDPATLQLFARKGVQSGDAPAHNANGVKVRRVMQVMRDFARKPFRELRVLDLACGEGVYSIEAALAGAEVLALDARTERMDEGAKAAERLGLKNLRFEQADVRAITAATHGRADVILFLGILYHLDERDVFSVLKNLHDMCSGCLIIDTHIALRAAVSVNHDGQRYTGMRVWEHEADDATEVRRRRLQASIDNPTSFWFDRLSLMRLLKAVGFTSVCEVGVPLEPRKPDDRVTLVASVGEAVRLASYPWVNDKSEEEIARLLAEEATRSARRGSAARRVGRRALDAANVILRALHLEIRRI
jgi:SAM-dependent methyltransferase